MNLSNNNFLLQWVGGRYSLWSAIGLSIALHFGEWRWKTSLLERTFQLCLRGSSWPSNFKRFFVFVAFLSLLVATAKCPSFHSRLRTLRSSSGRRALNGPTLLHSAARVQRSCHPCPSPNNFYGAQSHALLPYDQQVQYMHRFAAYFQQVRPGRVKTFGRFICSANLGTCDCVVWTLQVHFLQLRTELKRWNYCCICPMPLLCIQFVYWKGSVIWRWLFD